MDTEYIEPLSAPSAPAVTETIATKDKQAVHLDKKLTVEQQLANGIKWSWQDALYLLTLLLLVVGMAWYFTPNITGEVAGVWWDPLLNMWTLSWDTTTLLHAPTHLWQAQLLYPNNLTLSYSENLLGEVIFFAPVFLLTHNPALSYNVTFYITFLLCGTNMYIVARRYTGKPLAAFVAALLYAFAPYRLGQIDHIHVIAGEWMPLAFLYLDLSLQQSRWRHWSLLALFYFLQILSSIYYGIFLTYTLLTYLLIRYTKPFLVRLRQEKSAYLRSLLRSAIKPAAVFAVMILVLVILMAPYLASLSNGLARTLSQTAAFSAFVRDFLFAAPFNLLYGTQSYNGVILPIDSEHFLFFGWAMIALVALGIILTLRRSDTTMRALLWTGLIVLLFAFGPTLQFSGPHGAPIIPVGPSPTGKQLPPHIYPPNFPMPWQLAYYVLPGFKGLRAPARLIGVLLVMLSLLAAYAVAWLQEVSHKDVQERKAIPARPLRRFALPSWRVLLVQFFLLLVSFVILLEGIPINIEGASRSLPITQVPIGNQVPAVYQWLATNGGDQPIVELPISQKDGKDEAWYDYYAIFHPHPIVNGWSGYRPPLTVHIAAVLLGFPSLASLSILKQYHILYVVLHLQRFSPGAGAALLAKVEASPDLTRVAVFGSDSVWQVK